MSTTALLGNVQQSDYDDKVAAFKEKMDADVNNRRLARFAMAKSQGLLRNYASLPYYYKYTKEFKTDELTNKYARMLQTPGDSEGVKLIDNIFTAQRRKRDYFMGTMISLVVVILLIILLLLLMFVWPPEKNMAITWGVSIGAILAFPLLKLWFDSTAVLAWWNTRNKFT